jgi:hypothetical protein
MAGLSHDRKTAERWIRAKIVVGSVAVLLLFLATTAFAFVVLNIAVPGGDRATESAPAFVTPVPTELAGYVLPTISPNLEVGWVCAGVGLSPLFLEGRLVNGMAEVWAGTPSHRIPLRWPAAYRARFEPGLVIVNRDGIVVAHGGDNMDTGVPPWPSLYVCPYGSGVPGQFVVDVYQMAASPSP